MYLVCFRHFLSLKSGTQSSADTVQWSNIHGEDMYMHEGCLWTPKNGSIFPTKVWNHQLVSEDRVPTDSHRGLHCKGSILVWWSRRLPALDHKPSGQCYQSGPGKSALGTCNSSDCNSSLKFQWLKFQTAILVAEITVPAIPTAAIPEPAITVTATPWRDCFSSAIPMISILVSEIPVSVISVPAIP